MIHYFRNIHVHIKVDNKGLNGKSARLEGISELT